MEGRSTLAIFLSEIEADLAKVHDRPRLITLRREMQPVHTLGVEEENVSATLFEFLDDLDISTIGSEMESCETVLSLLVDPLGQDLLRLMLILLLDMVDEESRVRDTLNLMFSILLL